MSHPLGLPTPASCQRDADGRLVGLVFDSAPPIPTPESKPWLVAIDSSDNALRAVTHIVRQAGEMTACAPHLVNVQPWRLHVAMGETAEQIIALAGHLGSSGIVIGSRGLGAMESLLGLGDLQAHALVSASGNGGARTTPFPGDSACPLTPTRQRRLLKPLLSTPGV